MSSMRKVRHALVQIADPQLQVIPPLRSAADLYYPGCPDMPAFPSGARALMISVCPDDRGRDCRETGLRRATPGRQKFDHDQPISPGWFLCSIRLGPLGSAAVGPGSAIVAVVDMPSFPTALSVAVDQGIEVFPFRWRDHTALAYAQRHQAVLAVSRSQASEPGCVSLSPATIRRSSGIERLVLRSPNGSTIFSKPCRRRLARDRGVTPQRRRRSGPALDDLQIRTDPQIHQAMLASIPTTAARAAAAPGWRPRRRAPAGTRTAPTRSITGVLRCAPTHRQPRRPRAATARRHPCAVR